MVFNADFNNISVISWLSVLSVENTRVLGENHQPAAILKEHCSNSAVEYISSTTHPHFIFLPNFLN
jgi:hypothetical protein